MIAAPLTAMHGNVLDAAEYQERKGRAPGGGITHRELCSFMDDVRNQPPWRRHADKCVDYYDGNQLDADTLRKLDQKGMGPLITNVIAPIVNVVLGMEAKTRSDWRVTADDDRWQEVAEAKSVKLMEAERETRADRACSDGYAGQIKAGLGWVEVSRRNNPFEYAYRVSSVHRREIFWDWHDQDPMLSNATYLLRKRFYDVKQAIAYFPKHAELLRAMFGDPLKYELMIHNEGPYLLQDLDTERGPSLDDLDDWRLTDRQRLALYEVWYRQWVRGYVLRLPDGTPVELDMRNRMHVALLATRRVRPELAVYSKMRLAIFAGPHKLHDCACSKNYFPYVPFWGYREDLTGTPYGLIRAMLSPQDEVNARVQKMYWLLGAKRVRADSDAIDLEFNTWEDVLNEVARPDALIVQNKNRTNRDAMQIDDNLQLSEQQFKLLQERKMAVQEVVGVFNALLGRDGGANSGVAIDSLVEQGTTALAEINDNYRYARRTVGERLVDLIDQDLIGTEVQVMIGDPGRRKTVVLNKVILNENTGEKAVINDVARAKVKVALEDVPSTPSYRQQQLTMLAEVTKGLPPELQAAIAPFYMEATSLQKRREMADAIRKALGQVEPRTPEEAQALEQQQQEQQELQRRTILADLMEREAKAQKLKAEAVKVMREIEADPNADASVRAEYEQRVAEVQRAAEEKIDQLSAEVLTVRSTAGSREQKLLGELAKVNAALAAGAKSQAATLRAKEIDKEIAEINADKDRDVARISQASDAVVEAMRKEMDSLREQLMKRIDSAEAKAEQREAKAAVQRERDAAKAKAKPAEKPVDVVAVLDKAVDRMGKAVSSAIGEAMKKEGGAAKSVVFERDKDGNIVGAKLADGSRSVKVDRKKG